MLLGNRDVQGEAGVPARETQWILKTAKRLISMAIRRSCSIACHHYLTMRLLSSETLSKAQ